MKPANLLSAADGRTKVSHFGLATRTAGVGVASPYGYVIHCAPEVIDPGETTAKTDVYALGMTLYRLLNGDSFLADVAELGVPLDEAVVAGDFPDRTRFRDHIPKAVVRLVRKAISFDPAKRTASAAELRHDIERAAPAVSFVEVPSRDVAAWEGTSAIHTFEARIAKDGDRFSFTIRRARHGRRAVTRSNARGEFDKESSCRKHARGVLQDLGQPL